MKKTLFVLSIIAVWLVTIAATKSAANAAYFWTGHAAPFSFLFGNEIDTHQQSKAVGSDQIQGFLFVRFTGETIDGIPVAEHVNCDNMPSDCQAGWKFQGSLTEGIYVGHNMENHHPQFCVDPASIQQGRSYSHFHWLGDPMMAMDLAPGQSYPGYAIKLTAVKTFYFRHHEALFLVHPGVDNVSHLNILTDCP